jgi:hypothetical protein
MEQAITLFGLPLKTTSHCIITSVDAIEEADVAATELITHIQSISGRKN